MLRKIIYTLTVFLVSGCATPVIYSEKPMQKYDKNTNYVIEPRQNGFDISVIYTRYQFIPESDAVIVACKQALTSIAWEKSENDKKEILPINEQRIRMSMGRNGLTGMTTCSAIASVQWKY